MEEILIHPDIARDDPPPCFKSQWQWDDWVIGELKTLHEPGAVELGLCPQESSHCTVCTPSYKKQMVAEGRCEHHDVTFTIDENGFEGHRPHKVHLLKLIKTEEA